VTASSHFHFEYDAESRIFAVRMRGIITDKIFKDCYTETPRHVRGRDIRAALMDLSDVERVVDALTQAVAPHAHPRRRKAN